MLNRVKEELPSVSDVAKEGDIELQEMMENTVKSMADLITQLDNQTLHPLHDLLGLDKELIGIQDSLKVETAKGFGYSNTSRGKSAS